MAVFRVDSEGAPAPRVEDARTDEMLKEVISRWWRGRPDAVDTPPPADVSPLANWDAMTADAALRGTFL